MTDDELTKEGCGLCEGKKLDECGQAVCIDCVYSILEAYNPEAIADTIQKARAAGYEEAREQAAKTVAQLMQIANRDGAAALRRACESIRSMKPEGVSDKSSTGEGK